MNNDRTEMKIKVSIGGKLNKLAGVLAVIAMICITGPLIAYAENLLPDDSSEHYVNHTSDELLEPEHTLVSITLNPVITDPEGGIPRDNVIHVSRGVDVSYDIEPAELKDKVEVTFSSDHTEYIDVSRKDDYTDDPDAYKANRIWGNRPGTAEITATAVYREEGEPDQSVTSEPLTVEAVYPRNQLFYHYGLRYASDEYTLYTGWLSKSGEDFFTEKLDGNNEVYYFADDPDPGWRKAVSGEQTIDGKRYKFDDDCRLIREWIKLEEVELDPVEPDPGNPGIIAKNTLSVGSRAVIRAKLKPSLANDDRDPEWIISDPSVLKVTSIRPENAQEDELYGELEVLRLPEDPEESINIKLKAGDDDNRVTTTDDKDLDIYVTNKAGWQIIGGKTFYGEPETDAYGRTRVNFVTGWWPNDHEHRNEANREYFFDDEGVMVTGILDPDDGKLYDMGEDGVLCGEYEKKGFVKLKDGTVYYDNDGNRVFDDVITAEDGERYYINEDGFLAYGWFEKTEDGIYRRWYRDPKGKTLKGWQTVDGSRYYFEDKGLVASGVVMINGAGYFMSDEEADYGLLLKGSFDRDGRQYFADNTGKLYTGWRYVNNGLFFEPEYYSNEEASYGQKQTVTPLDGMNTGWYEVSGTTGADGLYYIKNGRSLKKGNTKICVVCDDDHKKDFSFCLDPLTGRYHGETGTVTSDGKCYFNEEMEAPYNTAPGYPHVALIMTGEHENDGITYITDKKGILLRGWNRLKNADNTYVWRYFRLSDGAELTKTGLDADNVMLSSPQDEPGNCWGVIRENGVETSYYFKNGTTLLKKGWQSIEGTMRYCDPVTGAVTTPVFNGNWASFEDGSIYYFKNGKTPVKGIAMIAGDPEHPDSTEESGFFFDTATGKLNRAGTPGGYMRFTKNGFSYEADHLGRLTTGWGHSYKDTDGTLKVRTEETNENIQADSYYDKDSRMVKNRFFAVKTGNAAGDYFFDKNGRMLSGITSVNGKRYVFGQNTADIEGNPGISKDRGKLQKDLYGILTGLSDKMYLSDKNGVLLTDWQKVRDAETDSLIWHFFDPLSGEEHPGRWDPDKEWYIINLIENGRRTRAKFYFTSSGPAKGFKKIDGKTYYFDATGRLLTGLNKIGNTTYYFSETVSDEAPHTEGMLMCGDVYSVGNGTYYTTKTGAVRTGWFTDNKRKYYADPVTGKLATGFTKIGSKIYFFSDSDSTLGQLQTGFIKLSYKQQLYYDKTEGASNLYYADEKGVVNTGGWLTVSLDKKSSDAQAWSYYTDQGRPMKDMGDFVLTGEVTVGDVLMDDNGDITYLDDGMGENDGFAVVPGKTVKEDIARYVRFDPVTGARRRTVLYFCGNYYGMNIDEDQLSTVSTMRRYINTDMKYKNESGDFVIVNASEDFPMCASGDIADEKSSFRKQTTGGRDNDLNNDGHIDVLDTEIFSKALYNEYIKKYGPKNLVLMGASSGAGICLGLYDHAITENDPDKLPCMVLLFSPWVDVSMNNVKCGKLKKNQTGSTDLATLKYWGARYTRDRYYEDETTGTYIYRDIGGPGVRYPFASPVYSPNKGRMKNVVMYSGTYDPCYFDCAVFAEEAKAAGNSDIILKRYRFRQHGFMFFTSGPDAVKATVDACRRVMTR
ncbi:MAG: alpha/beta hydrolase fold domain-containing protein [Lachnospiraceae bacterium]|nr:alpha/beta hydrolase fold domain-containing protein [Lachnospiraceae bacterium]